MAQRPFTTLKEIQSIVADKVPEGVTLEYKGSAVLIERRTSTICKTVSALANSVGGAFIIGIEMEKLEPIRIDAGTPGPSKRDWIYQVIANGTFPSVEGVDIHEFATGTGTIYSIDVPASPHAPHQSNDNKYYKRRGSHSDVMEHYEIEDVRNRPKRETLPLRADLCTRDILAYLRLSNSHETDALLDITCNATTNFKLDSFSLLTDRGLRALLPRSELHFLIGSMIEILQQPEPTLELEFRYTYRGRTTTQSASMYLADLNRTAIMKSPVERSTELLGQKIDKLAAHLDKLQQGVEAMSTIYDGTGLRVSQRTLQALRGQVQIFDPREFDASGYSIIAGLSAQDAYAVYRLFQYFPAAQAKEQYNQLSAEVRAQFEKHFKVFFDNE